MIKYPRPSRYVLHEESPQKHGIHFERIIERHKPGRNIGWLLLAFFAIAYLVFHLSSMGR